MKYRKQSISGILGKKSCQVRLHPNPREKIYYINFILQFSNAEQGFYTLALDLTCDSQSAGKVAPVA